MRERPSALWLWSCAYALGYLEAADLPSLAAEMLIMTNEACPALVELAGLDATQSWHAHQLWLDALARTGLSFPDAPTAVLTLARERARKLVEGELDEGTAAREIASLARDGEVADPLLQPFVDADRAWDEQAAPLATRSRGLRAAALGLLAP